MRKFVVLTLAAFLLSALVCGTAMAQSSISAKDCAMKIKTIAQAVELWANDNGGKFPTKEEFSSEAFRKYVKKADPSAKADCMCCEKGWNYEFYPKNKTYMIKCPNPWNHGAAAYYYSRDNGTVLSKGTAISEKEIKEIKDKRAKAEADKKAAELKAKAEKAKAEKNNSGKIKLDDKKTASTSVKTDAEKAKINAEKAKADAEKAKKDAEKAKINAENAKKEAEKAKINAEKAKKTEEAKKAAAEKAKADAVKAQKAEEAKKAAAEKAKADAEKAKKAEEAKKAAIEKAKKEASSPREVTDEEKNQIIDLIKELYNAYAEKDLEKVLELEKNSIESSAIDYENQGKGSAQDVRDAYRFATGEVLNHKEFKMLPLNISDLTFQKKGNLCRVTSVVPIIATDRLEVNQDGKYFFVRLRIGELVVSPSEKGGWEIQTMYLY